MSFKACVFILIFCLNDLSIGVDKVLKPPTIIVSLSVSRFMLLALALYIKVCLYWIHIVEVLDCLVMSDSW